MYGKEGIPLNMRKTHKLHLKIYNQSNPLVSVLMPVYNAGKYLQDAIESILNQSVSDFEFLIIDDGSTDNSWSIIKKYAKNDKRIKIFQNRTNKGLVKSLNFLIPKTKGTYIARMDADDISLAYRFERQIKFLENNPKLVACGGQVKIIDENGTDLAVKYFPEDPKTCHNYLINFMVIQPPTLIARGNIFRKLRYDNHIYKNDDISMHFKLIGYGGFGNVSSIIFKYRRVMSSVTHKSPKKSYFLALGVRLKAIFKYNFRPGLANLLFLIPETILVAILPDKEVLSVFEFLRFTHESARRVWQFGLSLPSQLLAKAGAIIFLPR
jgi:glycosyltransferase involved in cell wall biosynthesis